MCGVNCHFFIVYFPLKNVSKGFVLGCKVCSLKKKTFRDAFSGILATDSSQCFIKDNIAWYRETGLFYLKNSLGRENDDEMRSSKKNI